MQHLIIAILKTGSKGLSTTLLLQALQYLGIKFCMPMHSSMHCYSAMQRERKVARLEWEAIHVNYSYLLDQMAPDEILPHLAARRLFTPEKVKEVKENTNQLQKTITILEALRGQVGVGLLPTFCAALSGTAEQEHIAEKLTHCEFIPMLHV